MKSRIKGRLAIVLKGYPRLSETFIAQEIRELEKAGFPVTIVSLRHPTDKATHPIHDEIEADLAYLPEYVFDEPFRVAKAKMACLFKPGFWKAVPVFLKDLVRDRTANRVRRFAQAMVLAHEYVGKVDHLYVHFLHTPGSVTRYASIMTGRSFSISAHAKDIWTIPDWEVKEKIADCDWLVTCTRSGAEHLRALTTPKKIHLAYHGLDLSRFPNVEPAGRNGDGPLQLITVCRAVAKKGLDILLRSLADLPETIDWRWTHIGGGPLLADTKALAQSLGIDHRCEFRGAMPQSDVLEAYRTHDVFVLPSRIDDDGDRDGLPNVIVEAQSQKLPVISTNISGIPELIDNGKNGILIQPDDVDALHAALVEMATEPAKRLAMGAAGQQKVHSEFDHKQSIGKIVDLLDQSLEKQR